MHVENVFKNELKNYVLYISLIQLNLAWVTFLRIRNTNS